jgi:hypothetical protein
MEINNCTCAKNTEVQMAERNFHIDQGQTRAMMVVSINLKITNSMRRKEEMQRNREGYAAAKCLKLSFAQEQPDIFSNFDSESEVRQGVKFFSRLSSQC